MVGFELLDLASWWFGADLNTCHVLIMTAGLFLRIFRYHHQLHFNLLDNNNNGHLHCAGIRQVWRSWRMNIITSVRCHSRNTGARPLLFHNKCPGFFYVHYTTHGTYSFTSHPKDEAIMVKCLTQGHKRHDRPGRDSNPHSDNTRTWVRCTRPLGHDTVTFWVITNGLYFLVGMTTWPSLPLSLK